MGACAIYVAPLSDSKINTAYMTLVLREASEFEPGLHAR